MAEDKAREIAYGLIQGYIGPDHKVVAMKAFYSALSSGVEEYEGRMKFPASPGQS